MSADVDDELSEVSLSWSAVVSALSVSVVELFEVSLVLSAVVSALWTAVEELSEVSLTLTLSEVGGYVPHTVPGIMVGYHHKTGSRVEGGLLLVVCCNATALWTAVERVEELSEVSLAPAHCTRNHGGVRSSNRVKGGLLLYVPSWNMEQNCLSQL